MTQKQTSRRTPAASRPVRVQLGTIEKRLAQLEGASDTNAGTFSDAIQMLEVQLAVTRRALDDMVRGTPLLTTPGDLSTVPVRIDWVEYMKRYLQELADKEAATVAPTQESPLAVHPDEPVVFGGG